MTATKKSGRIFAIAALVLTAALLLSALAPTISAQTDSEIKISPDETSVFAAKDGAIVYTTRDGILHYAVRGGEHTSAFDGTAIDLAVADDAAFLLCDDGGEKRLLRFALSDDGVSSGSDAFAALGISSDPYVNIIPFFDGMTATSSALYVSAGAMTNGAVFVVLRFDGSSTYFQTSSRTGAIGDLACFDGGSAPFFVFVSGGRLYSFNGSNFAESVPIDDQKTWLSVAADGDTFFAAADDGIYLVEDGAITRISDEVADGDIRFLYEGGTRYLLVGNAAEHSVVQYSVIEDGDGFSLRYYNVFDNTIYVSPQDYDIVTAGKLAADANGYFSPKNLRPVAQFSAGDYVLVLAQADGYYYVMKADGSFCYLDTSVVTVLQRSEDTGKGRYCLPLTNDVPVRKYPIDGSEVLATVGVKDVLVVIEDVGSDGGAPVFDWLRVSFVDANGEVVDGYAAGSALGSYSNYRLPSFGETATIGADSLGDGVNVYILPEERDDYIIGTLNDGDEVELAQEKLIDDEEWTKIKFVDGDGTEVTGYVKTANLTQSGMTTLQITLTVVFCIVAVVSIAVVAIIVKKRKYERYE